MHQRSAALGRCHSQQHGRIPAAACLHPQQRHALRMSLHAQRTAAAATDAPVSSTSEQPSSRTQQSPADKPAPPKLALPRYTRRLNWDRWIYLMSLKPVVVTEQDDDEVDEALAPVEHDGADGAAASTSETTQSNAQSASISFFRYWDNPAVHMPYLRDEALMSAYRRAIEQNGELMRGKIVLDLGCGPGHLAMMCAQAGAKRVYAVDGSASTVELAKQLVSANGLSSRVTVLHSPGEEVQLKEQVDVIVSDCVGPMLLGGGMMGALATARRTLLKPGGLVLPDEVELFVAGVDDRDHLMIAKEQWQKLQRGLGVDMSAAMAQVARTPRLDTLYRPSQLFTNRCQLSQLSLRPGGDMTVRRASQQGFSAPFTLEAQREERLFALMLWVQAKFTFGGQAPKPVIFSADPDAPPTHQKQLLLNFPKSIRMAKGDTLSGTIRWYPSPEDARAVQVEVQVDYKGVAASTSYVLPALMASLAAGDAAADL